MRKKAVSGRKNGMKRPHDNCYWVIPGRLMAGEYPFAIREEDGRKKLASIVETGISHFIDLTQTGILWRLVDQIK